MKLGITLSLFSLFLFGKTDFNAQKISAHKRSDGQIKVWVYFHDKGEDQSIRGKREAIRLDEKAIMRRNKVNISSQTWYDIPVSESYIHTLELLGITLHHKSRWLNAVSIFADEIQLVQIAQLKEVREIKPVYSFKKSIPAQKEGVLRSERKKAMGLDYGPSQAQVEQIKAHQAHDAGFMGQGVRVLMMDTGYYTDHEAFDSLTVIAKKDFVDGDEVVSDEAGKDPSGQHNHGTYTWSALGGYVPGRLIGPAYKSEFLLAKTERLDEEIQQEEDDYVAGLEWGESLGADVVSTSLGYLDWYSWSDMDGNTAVTTKAVDIAVSLGMVCVTAAGNENGGFWNHIIAPADADSVISVGAVDKYGNIASFSSRGPSFDGRIKPEVSARGVNTYCASPSSKNPYVSVNGTSLATPLVGGAAAIILSAHPDWTPMMVREALMMTADRWMSPDNNYGWGIIDVWSAINYDKFSAGVKGELFIPDEFAITKAFPNPFNPNVHFYINMGKTGLVNLSIYNLLGQPVESLFMGELKSGVHSFVWKPNTHPAGVYFIHLDYRHGTQIRKITYLK